MRDYATCVEACTQPVIQNMVKGAELSLSSEENAALRKHIRELESAGRKK